MRSKGWSAGVRAVMAALLMAWQGPVAAQGLVQAPGGFVPRQAMSYGAAGDAAVAVDDRHPLPVAPQGRGATLADRSGAIAVAAGAQPLAPANPLRTGFMVQNLSTGDLWVTSGGTAVAGSPAFRVGPGQLFEFPATGVPQTALSILGATAGQSFSAREW